MVAQNRISAVVSSTDLESSRELYEQKVGLTLSETIPNHLLFEGADGMTLLVYGRPSPNLADHTQVRFWCADVAADVSGSSGGGWSSSWSSLVISRWSTMCSRCWSAAQHGSKTRMATPSSSSSLPSFAAALPTTGKRRSPAAEYRRAPRGRDPHWVPRGTQS